MGRENDQNDGHEMWIVRQKRSEINNIMYVKAEGEN